MKKTAVRTKAVIYARVSSKEQEAEGFSVDAQIRLLRAYATEANIDVAVEFLEAETAKKAGRTSFNRMLKFLLEHPNHVILVEKIDRLYRNFADYVKVDALGVELHFVKDGMVISDKSKSQDKFMHGIRVLMAKNYVDNLSEEIRKGLNEKAEQGIYPTHAPLGYLNTIEPGTKRKTITPDPARAHLVKQIFDLYATGLESYDSLTKWARVNVLTTKKGNPLVRSKIEQILQHPAYCGIVRWHGKETIGVHEPIISRETWNRVQDIRHGRRTNAGFGGKEFTYRGLIRCKCGEIMTGELKKGKYVYYHCTGRKRSICDRPYVSEAKITEAVSELLKKLHVDDRDLEWMSVGLHEADRDRHNRRHSREQELNREIRETSRKLEQLYLDKTAGEISSELYKQLRTKWEQNSTDLKLELAAIDRVETSSVDQTMQLLELASSAHIRFKDATSEEQRQLLSRICSNCSWIDGKLEVELRPIFDLMLNSVISQINEGERNEQNDLVLAKSVDWWR